MFFLVMFKKNCRTFKFCAGPVDPISFILKLVKKKKYNNKMTFTTSNTYTKHKVISCGIHVHRHKTMTTKNNDDNKKEYKNNWIIHR